MSIPPELVPLKPGDRIGHRRFGVGVVLMRSGDVLDVLFDEDGEIRRVQLLGADVEIEARSGSRISPTWDEIVDRERFVPRLTYGEIQLARLLDSFLPADWRIYVRPHLDGDHPVIAALHPDAGGMVWTVADWPLAGAHVHDGYVEFLVDGERHRGINPFVNLDHVRRRIYETYVPTISEAIDSGEATYGLIRAGVFFARATTAQARAVLGPSADDRSASLFGLDAVVGAGHLEQVVPILGRRRAPAVSGWFESLDRLFTHAYRVADPMTELIKPTPAQAEIIRLAPGATVVDGVAGSGKSIVVVARAASLAAGGRRVLVLTYNRTLGNYLRAQLSRLPLEHRRDRVVIRPFHELISLIHAENGEWAPHVPEPSEGDGDTRSRVLDEEWPESAARLLRERPLPENLRYDAVLVDEGQDFSPQYARMIDALVPPPGRDILVAHDPAQRIYERASALDAGRWPSGRVRHRSLKIGVRLPEAAARAASDYAKLWGLPTPAIDGREPGILPDSGGPTWVPVASDEEAVGAVVAILASWAERPGYLPGRGAVLVPSKAFGARLVTLLAERDIRTVHVFAIRRTSATMDDTVRRTGPDWVVARERKLAFTFDDARLKVSTVASFKGWSSSRVILVLPAGRPRPDSRLLRQVYVGLTRSEGEAVFVGRPGESFGIDDLGLPRPKVEVDREAATRYTELAIADDTASSGHAVRGSDLGLTEPMWPAEEGPTNGV